MKGFAVASVAERALYEKRDKHAIVAILGTIDSFHNVEVIYCTISRTMWTQLQEYHDQH